MIASVKLRCLVAGYSGVENVGIVAWAYIGEKGVADGLSTDDLTPTVSCAAGVETVLGLGGTVRGIVHVTVTGVF